MLVLILASFDVESLTRQLRENYIYALLHHEVEYIESKKPGILGQTLSEESSRIINGLGPSIGQLVRAIATFLAGVIIGFSYVELLCANHYRVGSLPFSRFLLLL